MRSSITRSASSRERGRHLVTVGEVDLVGRLPTVRPRDPGGVVGPGAPAAATEASEVRAGVGPEGLDERLLGAGRELGHGVEPDRREPLADPGADAPQGGGRSVPHHVEPVVTVQEVGAVRLAEVGRDLGPDEGVADPDRAGQARPRQHGGLDLQGRRQRVVGVDPDERLVPAQHLHHRARVARAGSPSPPPTPPRRPGSRPAAARPRGSGVRRASAPARSARRARVPRTTQWTPRPARWGRRARRR